jgi:hypothetical protein
MKKERSKAIPPWGGGNSNTNVYDDAYEPCRP